MGIETAAGVSGKAALEFVQNENVLNIFSKKGIFSNGKRNFNSRCYRKL